ncbi:MAG: ComEA family DNA-binding protein [Egibacteraceae bacterium]
MAAPTAPSEDRTVLDRVLRGLARLGCSGAEIAALALLVGGGVAALGLLWVLARPGAAPAADQQEPAGEAGSPEAPALVGEELEELVVHVAGEVAAPGLHRLPDGARVADALEAAGGPLPDAGLDALNLARPLTDGEQLFVPGPGPPPGQPAAGHTEQGGPAPPSAVRPDGLLDLNRATPDDLEELPGIGPVLAERIVEHRDTVGGFGAVGDLRDVPGIGEKKFQSIAELVAV